MLSEVMEYALCYDQIDVSNLASFERLIRRMQLIEEQHRQKLGETRAAKGNKDMSSSIAEHFSGRPQMSGGAIISPALIKYAAEKATQQNEILKQQRKVAETRALLKKK